MKRLFAFALLTVLTSSGCFWGFRGHRRGEGEYRHDEHREHDERDHRRGDQGRDYDHHEGR
jgi:hypothetical protein